MNYKVLYRKYRPITFDEIFDQKHTVKMLKSAIINDKMAHAYLFTGPRGTGKTSTAKIFARAINCENPLDGNPCNECAMCKIFNESPDIIEIDAASNNGVDEIRELINNIKLVPSFAKYKVYIIDEVHMLSTSAFNALLLTLEEPPSHVVFILATTDVQNVPITILSRCQRFDFRKINIDEIMNKLKYICDKENIKITDEALREIAFISDGGLRDAESILDQVMDTGKAEITIDDISQNFGTISNSKLNKILEAIDKNNPGLIIENLSSLSLTGVESSTVVLKLMESIKKRALNVKLSKEVFRLPFSEMKNLIFDLNKCLVGGRSSVDPYMLIELTLMDYLDFDVHSSEQITIKEKMQETPLELAVEKDIVSEKTNHQVEKIEEIPQNIPNLTEFKRIRVNNCLCNAKKDYLNTIKSQWDRFIEELRLNSISFMNIIIDADVVAASDKYLIITHNLDSATNLINEKHEDLEKAFSNIFEREYRFVAIMQDEWLNEKKIYVKNLKEGISYSLIEDIVLEKTEKTHELEKIASEIFNKDCIEVK